MLTFESTIASLIGPSRHQVFDATPTLRLLCLELLELVQLLDLHTCDTGFRHLMLIWYVITISQSRWWSIGVSRAAIADDLLLVSISDQIFVTTQHR